MSRQSVESGRKCARCLTCGRALTERRYSIHEVQATTTSGATSPMATPRRMKSRVSQRLDSILQCLRARMVATGAEHEFGF